MAELVPSSQTVEDYLKAMYAIGERDGAAVSTSLLSERLGLSASSVSGMLRRLAARGLIDHARYGDISLTEVGRSTALQVVRRHRLVEMFLVVHLGYGWDEVHQEAEVLEHAVSDRLVERIDTVLGRPAFDPHGDPIPSRLGELPNLVAHRLTTLTPGQVGHLVRVDDHDPQVLRHLTGLGVGLGETVALIEQLPFGGDYRVRIGDGDELHFAPVLAHALWIDLHDGDPDVSRR